MSSGSTKYKLLGRFYDRLIPSGLWNDLWRIGSSDVIFIIWQWQKTWWKVFGRGQLLLVFTIAIFTGRCAYSPDFIDGHRRG